MKKPEARLTFDVQLHNVSVKALETLMDLANKEECGIVKATPHVEQVLEQQLPAKFMAPSDPVKQLIIKKLRSERHPVPRKALLRELRSNGFAKNSLGPICSEMKKQGTITNPRRGYWALPTTSTEHPA